MGTELAGIQSSRGAQIALCPLQWSRLLVEPVGVGAAGVRAPSFLSREKRGEPERWLSGRHCMWAPQPTCDPWIVQGGRRELTSDLHIYIHTHVHFFTEVTITYHH